MECGKSILVLSDKQWLSSRKSPLMFIAVLSAFTVLTLVYLLTVIFPNVSWDQLFAKLAESLGKIDWSHVDWTNTVFNLVMLGFPFGLFLYSIRAQKLERLTLSPDGIQYTSPLPSIFKRFKPDWFLPWNQVNKAELGALYGRLESSAIVQLTLSTLSEKRSIFAALWVDPENYSHPVSRFKFTITHMAKTPDEILKSVMASEVLQYISRNVPHLTIDSTLNKADSTSLEKNSHGRIAIGVIFLLVIYALFDFTLGPESYIDDPLSLLYIFIPAGICGAILSGAWLYRSTLATAEKIGLSLLIGVIVAVAMLPGALRINAFTDSNSANTYDYFVTQDENGVVLRSVVDGMPTIDYFAKNKFWGKFGKDDTYPVLIHKGSLGFYQFNSTAIVDDIHSSEKN